MKRKLALLSAAVMAAGVLVVSGGMPASAALSGPGLTPTLPDTPGGIPAQGDCGVGGFGEYVKFTTGGGTVDNAAATTTASKPYKARYSQDQVAGLFRVESLVTDPGGVPVFFNEIVGGVSSLNPLWRFAPTTAPSPTLNVTSNNNFSQWALCVYENLTLQVRKVVVGSPTTQAFDIDVDCVLDDPADSLPAITNHFDLSLSSGQTSALLTVPKGSVCTTTEPAVTGFSTAISPTPLGPLTSSGSVVRVTNTRLTASLTINKTQVGGTAKTWTFDVNCTGANGESLQALDVPIVGSGTATVSGIPTGLSCTVTEDQANTGGFDTSVSPTGVITVGSNGGSISFTNTARGALKISKVNVGGPAAAGFSISYDCGFGITGSVVLTGGGSATIGNLPAGLSCTVTESATGYTTVISTSPAVIPAGATVEVVVTNTRNTTSLTINKSQVGGTAQTWTFDVNCSGGGETFQKLDVTVIGTGTATVTGIPTGLSCTVTEDQANSNGFDTTSSPANGVVSVGTTGGTVAFTNTARARLTVTKTENGGAPTKQYTFRLTGGPANVSISRTTLVDPNPLDFGLVKPGNYTLCELGVPAGTSSSLSTLTGATEDATTGDVCAPITLTAGTTLQLSIDNQFATGGQRTIGYWKNWSTCGAKGNQVANAAATGKTLLDQVLPQTLGNYVVNTCAKGVAVLSNPAAKYAENQLAAQLLAAKANVAVGAACGTIATTIVQADAVLSGVGYAGPPSSIIGNNHIMRASALALASTLDQFNNGLLC